MDRAKVELPLFAAGLRCNLETADGVGASCVQHSIEDSHADCRFALLSREAARPQTRTNNGFVLPHRGFNLSALAIVGFFLLAQPSMCSNR